MTKDPDQAILELRATFLRRATERITTARQALAAMDGTGDGDARRAYEMEMHKLYGAGGTFGFPGISQAAGDAEEALVAGRDADHLARLLDRVEAEIAAVVNQSR